MFAHAVPLASQRCHTYVNEVGVLAQSPSLVFRVESCRNVPDNVGGDVVRGTAASAVAAATRPMMATVSSDVAVYRRRVDFFK